MDATYVNKYLDDWMRAMKCERISHRDKEREAIDLRENRKA